MGGFNIGEIYGLLKLDNSEFLKAIEQSKAESALLSIRLANLYSNDLKNLQREFAQAGFSVTELNNLVRKFYAAGYSKPEAVEQISKAVMDLRGKLSDAFIELSKLKTAAAGGYPDRKAAAAARGDITEPFAETLKKLQQMVEVQQKELENYRAILEAERIRTRQISERIAKETDYKNLVAKIRAEAEAADKKLREAKTVATDENDRILKPQRDAEVKHLRDIAAMREFYNKQSLDAANTAAEAAAKHRAQIDKQSAENAKKYQKEVLDQVAGDEAARERIEKERIANVEKATRDALRREREVYQNHWREMQKASALTTIGGTLAGAGGLGVGAGLFVAKDAAQFKDAMVKSLADIGDISEQMRAKLETAAREAAKETGIQAKNIAADYAIMAKGGLTAAQSLQLIPAVSKFAVATNSELHESTKQIITIMEALQIPFSQVGSLMDKLTFANNIARGSVDQLATALEGRAGAALRSAKVSIDEALAITIAFSKAGVNASQSQTYVTQIIEKLREVASKYGDEIIRVGEKQMRFRDIVFLSDGTMRPFVQTLKLLDTAFQGRSAQALNNLFNDLHIGSARGGQALKILLGTVESLDAITGRLGETQGQTMHNFDIMMQSPIKQLEVLKARFMDLAITIGIPVVAALQAAAKAAEPLLQIVAGLAAKFGELPAGAQSAIVGIAGIASVSALAGGSLLLFVGHIVRLRADLLLLQQSGALTGFLTFLSGAAFTATGVAIAVAAAAAAILDLRKKLELIKNSSGSEFDKAAKKNPAGGIGLSILTGILPSSLLPSSGDSSGTTEPVSAHRQAGGNTTGTTDEFRETLEKLKAFKDEISKLGDIGINPEKLIKNSLKIETLRQAFQAFSDAYNREMGNLSKEEQSIMAALFGRLGEQLSNGVDFRLIKKSLDDAEEQLKRFKQDAAIRQKDEAAQLARENAASTVAAFRERYEADMRNFSSEDRALMEQVLSSIQDNLNAGGDTKRALADLKLIENFYKSIADGINQDVKLQKLFNDSVRDFHSQDRKENRQNSDILGFESRIDPRMLAFIQANRTDSENQIKVDSIMRGLGAKNDSQAALNLQRAAAEGLYKELQQLEHTANDEKLALVKMWEAEAAAAHTSVESMGGDAKRFYREYKLETENSVRKANSLWRDHLAEIGRGMRQLVSTFAHGLLDIILPKSQTDTKDKLQPLVTAFRDVYEQLSAYSDPKRALEGVIKAIQTAGTQAQANAIAVKYFGKQAGPELARELRDGTIGANDIAEAIKQATQSTLDYANKTEDALNKVNELWRNLVRDLLKLILENLIKAGFVALIGALFNIQTANKSVTDVLIEAWGKVWDKIKGVHTTISQLPTSIPVPGGGGGGGTLPPLPGGEIPGVPGRAPLPGGGVPTIPGGGEAGGAVSSTLSTVSQITSIITGAVTAIASVVQAFQLHGIGNDTGKIEVNTRGSLQEALNLRADLWNQSSQLMFKLDDVWKEIREGNLFGYLKLILSKYEEFIIPNLISMNAALVNISNANGMPVFAGHSGGGPKAEMVITGDIIVNANRPEDFVREMRRRRNVRGVR